MRRPSFALLAKQRQKLKDILIQDYLFGEHVSGSVQERLVQLILDFIRRPSDYRPGVDDVEDYTYEEEVACDDEHQARRARSVENLLNTFRGQYLREQEMRRLCICVTGRLQELRDGRVTSAEWSGTTEAEDTLLYVRDVYRSPGKGNMYAVEMEAFSGPLAGWQWSVRLTGGFLQHTMRDIGAPRYEKALNEDISGMWFLGTLKCQNGSLQLLKADVTESQRKHNRQLAKGRQAVCNVAGSPFQGRRCGPCPLSRKQCPRARFFRAFTKTKLCANKHQGLFRSDEDKYCWLCTVKGEFHAEGTDCKSGSGKDKASG